MSTLFERRARIGVAEIETQLANLSFVEPLTQSPDLPSPDTAVREDDDKANPMEEEDPSHACGSCGMIFLCVGDANGNRAHDDLCDCEQAITVFPLKHLVFYCSTACRHV